jgi:hypothetical protein
MSTDPYPEVTVDESGLVPPQGARTSEWPKKLRTLTAAELDRLTIDNSGRFYWDGKLVSYDTQQKQLTDQNSNSLDRSMDIIDRATYELGGSKTPATIEGELTPAEAPSAPSDRAQAVDLDVVRAEVAAALAEATPAPAVTTTIEQKHLTLSGWQKFGALIVVLGIAVGAFGMATYGYVAARDWGCKTGAFQKGCPVEKAAPQRADIPA